MSSIWDPRTYSSARDFNFPHSTFSSKIPPEREAHQNLGRKYPQIYMKWIQWLKESPAVNMEMYHTVLPSRKDLLPGF